ncbi:MAG: hypothetical protein LBJ00_01720 [Planctomycetaceae bacterium]|nr:hypothetical protein [Planctomycetaceae bacterium]
MKRLFGGEVYRLIGYGIMFMELLKHLVWTIRQSSRAKCLSNFCEILEFWAISSVG